GRPAYFDLVAFSYGEPLHTSPENAPATSQAAAQAAVGAGRRRRIAEQAGAEGAVFLPVPDFAQALLGGVAQREGIVAAQGERRDAARQRAPVRSEIHQGPRPRAQRPRPLVV